MHVDSERDSRLIAALAEMRPPEHLCSVYETIEEHLAVAIPFLRMGLDRGEKCIYVQDDGTENLARAAMASHGIDVERAIATERLVLLSKEDVYLRHGRFDPEWVLTFWADAGAEAKRQGFRSLRAVGEMDWMLRGSPDRDRWRRYESQLTRLVAEHECVVLCQYNRLHCPPEIVLDVIRTHPTVIHRGAVCRNMYHVPPGELLGPGQDEREVTRLLFNIRDREAVESALTGQRNELRESEARFRQIAENIREVFWVWDVEASAVVFVSPTYEDVFGRSTASLRADFGSFFEAIHPDDRARVEATVALSRAGKQTDQQYRIVRPDGALRWVRDRAFPVPDPTGAVRRVVGVADDITERTHAEEGLRRSEEVLRVLLDSLPVGVILVDRGGDIVLGNPASARIWAGAVKSGPDRYAESKAWWYETGERVTPEGWASARALSTGELSVNEVLEIEAFDGVRKTIQNSAVPIRDGTGAITGAVVVNEDISARMAAERALRDSYNHLGTLTGRLMRAQDDERKRIAQLLHETTAQDLAALKMLLARLNRTAGLGAEEHGVVVESIALADRSMTEIRTLSYLLHPPFLDEAGLVSALRWYAAGFAKRSGIQVELDLPENFPRLPPDTETALFRVVQESLMNIHRHGSSETARIRLRASDDGLLLEIDDSGRGIPSSSLKEILEGGGTAGVGIAGMSERMKQLGGRLEVTSGEGGTTVRARVPLTSGEA
jgi:PAS domain S-box-containing protein